MVKTWNSISFKEIFRLFSHRLDNTEWYWKNNVIFERRIWMDGSIFKNNSTWLMWQCDLKPEMIFSNQSFSFLEFFLEDIVQSRDWSTMLLVAYVSHWKLAISRDEGILNGTSILEEFFRIFELSKFSDLLFNRQNF